MLDILKQLSYNQYTLSKFWKYEVKLYDIKIFTTVGSE